MRGLDPNDPSAFELIEAIIERVEREWSDELNVVGLAPALKVSQGQVDPQALVIGFYVEEKVPAELLSDRGYRPIPTEIEGVPTDVILARQRAHGTIDEKATRSQMFDTLVGGIAVGNANMDVYGTLALTLLAESDGRMVGLTNEHVLVFDIDGHVGDEVQQPRFYLNSEVSLDSASCCPNGVLHYRGVDNPVVDAAAAVFAAAAIAAAASDEIDPHRRGQDATAPAADERTIRETVAMAIDYPELPLPGTSYRLGVDWTYQRETDQRVLEHTVSEEKHNPHVIAVQHLLTDKRRYQRGETVTFLALLGHEEEGRLCDRYFVTAAALSPSHHRAYKVILRPFEPPGAFNERVLTHGAAGHSLEGRTVRRCFDYKHRKIGERFSAPRLIEGVRYDPEGATAVFVHDSTGALALRVPRHGLGIALPSPAERIMLRLQLNLDEPMAIRAYSGDAQVDEAEATARERPAVVEVALAGDRIDRLELKGGGGEALLEELCVETGTGRGCLYRGTMDLAPNEELGFWSTYVFAQTSNDVALGVDPLAAAPVIGGLPVTHNFVFGGDTDNVAYGHMCNIDLVSDGSFEVIQAAPIE